MMNNTNYSEREINQIRVELYNESKKLSVKEQIQKTNQVTRQMAAKFSVKFIDKN